MGEAIVVYLFLAIRVLVVGGFLLILPRITRKGLLFGFYVGEERAEAEEARRVLNDWYRGCKTLMVVTMVVGVAVGATGAAFGMAHSAVVGNFTGTAVLLLGALVLYVRVYSRARLLVPTGVARQAETAIAPLEAGRTNAERFAMVALAVCLLTALATGAYAMVRYEAMPDRVPSYLSAFGAADGFEDKSILAVMSLPSLNLVLSPFYALLALLTATAKRSMRAGSGGRSIEAQDAFRAAVANLVSGMALLICALLTLLSVQTIRFGFSETNSLGAGIWWIVGVLLVFVSGSLIMILKRYGQGGALIEQGSTDAPLTGGLADDTHWRGGLFYIDRDDPSIMVEKRFGIGYTFNYGNPTAVLITSAVSVLLVSVAVIGFIGIVH